MFQKESSCRTKSHNQRRLAERFYGHMASLVLLAAVSAMDPAMAQSWCTFSPGGWSNNNDPSCPTAVTQSTLYGLCLANTLANGCVQEAGGTWPVAGATNCKVSTSLTVSPSSSCPPSSNAQYLQGTLVDNGSGLVLYVNVNSVPTLPSWAVVVLSALLALIGFRLFNRRAGSPHPFKSSQS
jgi:hypothetical protein